MIGTVGHAMIGAIVKAMTPPDIRKDIENKMAKEIAREIDKEILDTIMIDVLVDEGWVQTNINPAFTVMGPITFDDWYSQTAEWIHINATGDYKLLNGQWLFKNPKDATMFILRWS